MIGTIIKGIGGFYYIKTSTDVIECKARGKFRHNELTPLVGDKVEIEVNNNKGVIEKIYERSSELIRPNVANVTQAYVVFSIKHPDLNFDLLNKFLVMCERKNLKIMIGINKSDLANEEEIKEVEEFFRQSGYKYIFIQAKSGIGLEELIDNLKDNVTVLCGPSGAGKSTLINKFVGMNHMETGEVSDKIRRGKHTTRHSELIEVEHGFIVDTPGFSSLDIKGIPKEELQYCFPEFNRVQETCKFTSCIHNKEPHCAIKAAVEEGIISKQRYESYIAMLSEIMNARQQYT
ncbi:ribosome small subunit-dependent GTPase A [Clostridium sp. 19966]|uniref:ribosome small subunit-dependent GTPase A n=1 Tax=Clostridium sp. 19966 TaxID=2768166 RepID=UPI0028DDBAD0|nr:ribosome small subunit-dependent GTPase A [Clostridium sp. 19966]MDT8716470.1 ribosome small subunit-dependent GTPase A [Clostridium sp. 19966]